MSIRARIKALERKRGIGQRVARPPIKFFDRIISGIATEQEWNRWAPWINENLGTLSDEPVERSAAARGDTPLPEDERL